MYLNRPFAQHITTANSLKQDGYRLLSLCLHAPAIGTASDDEVSYSAVWVKRSGPNWDMLMLGSEGELMSYLEDAKAKSPPYWPRLVAACGVSFPRFSVVVEQGGAESSVEVGTWGFFVPDTFEAHRTNGDFLRSIAVYTVDVNTEQMYNCACVWEQQPADTTIYFNGFSVADTAVDTIDAAMRAGFARVDQACQYDDLLTDGGSVTTKRRYFLVYRDDQIPGTTLTTGLTADSVEQAIQDGMTAGRWPIRLHSSGVAGADQRFAMILADYPHDQEPARTWTVARPTYPRSAGPNPWKTFSDVEQAFESSMKRHGVRAGQLAVAYQGRLVYAAGFTWAQAGYPITSPTVRFRVGSISKTITALATCQLWDKGKLYPFPYYPDNSIAALLKRSFKDKRFKNRHCGQLLSHLGRFDQDAILNQTDPDPHKIASDLGGVPLPLTMANVVDWIAKNMDDAFTQDKAPEPGGTPLPQAVYCGVGFTMMAQICAEFYEQMGYDSLEHGVQQELFAPVGVTRPRKTTMSSKTAWDGAMKGEEVICHPSRPSYWRSAQGDDNPAPVAYEATNSNIYLGNGSWALSCPDYARLLSAFDDSPNPLFEQQTMPLMILTEEAEGWYRGFVKKSFATGPGGTVEAMWHNGLVLGGAAVGFRRFDGVVIVYAWNTDVIGTGFPDVDANAAVNTISAWPSYDLFPSVGIE